MGTTQALKSVEALQATLNTECTNTSNPLTDMVSYLDERPEFEGTIKNYPGAQLLNDKSNAGLFIKDTDIAKSGWLGLPHNGIVYSHTYNDNTEQTGIVFKAPNLIILCQSPRFIELTRKGEDNGLGKAGTIQGIYADTEGVFNPNGTELYQQLGDQASLRTFYLIYIATDEGKELHQIPFCLSLKGVAASSFGRSLDAFANDFYAKASQISENAKPLNHAARSLFTFTPVFTSSLEPKDAPTKSWCCIVKTSDGSFEFTWKPLGTSNADRDKLNKRYSSIRKANNNFASRYMEEIHETVGFHGIASGVDLSSNGTKALPASVMIVEPEYQLT